ncbi:MAG: sigma-54 dependent transcriptional regulator [Myxococcota bacterium]|nr:sigma-54-dependent Fis family transcriptional regulator [Myxococcales bacterium]
MDRQRARILVADDEESIRFVLREALESQGHRVSEVADGAAALRALDEGDFDLAFLDIRMPEATGLEVLERAKTASSETAVVIITAQSTFENAVEAMKLGALDYLTKPFSLAEVQALTDKALRTRALELEVRALRREVGRAVSPGGDRLVGRSPALLEAFKTVGRVAARNVPVLITGESGTGKELIARAIHVASPRAQEPFVAVNAAAIPKELLESELFGHERGAFTGAVQARPGRFREAAGGTLFLDEIGDMTLDLQAKLLRVLQNGEVTAVGGQKSEIVDVRIIAATNRQLDVAVREGRFREDLLYRLRVVPIELPPLRERREDVRALAEHFVARYAQDLAGGARGLADGAIEALERYSWPGNVRELENAIRRALVLAPGSVLTGEDFAFLVEDPAQTSPEASLAALVARETRAALSERADEIYRTVIERVERPMIEAVLEHTGGNQLQAASLLGINRNTLRKKISELDVAIPRRDRA